MLIKQHLLDKRVVSRALKQGLLDAAQYQREIEQLPDRSANVQRTEAAETSTSSAHAEQAQL